MPRKKKELEQSEEVDKPEVVESTPVKQEKKIEITETQWNQLQEDLRRLNAVADKGRIQNYESAQATVKKPLEVKLSEYDGAIIVGWRTVTDISVFHETTGKQIGEVQEYEILLDRNGLIEKRSLRGYPAFSEARYGKRF